MSESVTPSYDPNWRRNLKVLWFGCFMVGMGFSIIVPFMSLYIDTLGDFSQSELSFWSGITISSTFLVMALVSPIWGKLADTKGRRLMLLRASLGMSIIIALMGVVTNVQQLIILRLLQGVFSGYVSNANALIATTVPKEKSGQALGTMTTGVVSGTLLGPLFGGVVAQAFSYRVTFFITGTLLFLVFLLTVFLVKENFRPVQEGQKVLNIRQIFQNLPYPKLIIGLFVTTLIIQASNNSVNPILSLYVRQLLGNDGTVAIVSGIVAALPGVATLFAAPFFGRLGDKIGTQKILIGGIAFALILYIPQAFVHNVWQLGILRLLVGISDAAMLPQVQTLLAKNSPHEVSGRIFSYNQSFQGMGNVAGPLIGSFVSSSFGYPGVFLSTSLLVLINLIWVTINTRELRRDQKQ
ncbi:multidrug efflux MFS transporter [Holzapfeliella sp. He02]|uniref:Multidrug efflux MFS transporter n=1 Tax=Holzapfeliella saturejae TaxID=3082953 RepID=A0ABU8SH99_9LACO